MNSSVKSHHGKSVLGEKTGRTKEVPKGKRESRGDYKPFTMIHFSSGRIQSVLYFFSLATDLSLKM